MEVTRRTTGQRSTRQRSMKGYTSERSSYSNGVYSQDGLSPQDRTHHYFNLRNSLNLHSVYLSLTSFIKSYLYSSVYLLQSSSVLLSPSYLHLVRYYYILLLRPSVSSSILHDSVFRTSDDLNSVITQELSVLTGRLKTRDVLTKINESIERYIELLFGIVNFGFTRRDKDLSTSLDCGK